MTEVLLLAAVVVVLAVAVAVGFARHRRVPATGPGQVAAPQVFVSEWEQRMRALESTTGLRYTAEDQGFGERVPQIGRMLESDPGRIKAQLVGHWRGVPVLAVELVLRAQTGTTSDYRTYTAVVVPRPMPGPWVLISPREDGVWGLFEQFTATGDEAFDARYEVRRKNPAFATALLACGLPQWLLHEPRALGVAVLFGEHRLVAAIQAPLLQAPIGHLADLLLDVAGRVPWQSLPRG
ncbi:hypothetical protein KCV87_21305 [Actinosynnema pretiosum subsp. pretiosum]|uniref:Uncharacterized protein n=2 Tax=Actinosynnema TaxID=40566 RepID=C6WR37_ACTMD|nr:hypothetical protein [Actinosynnema mirum]ACU40730.1 hypothetical protein Amir_6935 [Actinosynnema mirum DSM 43827]QUF02047.1 hypothetical protein KCV87_21305 [Actinosynnema pretiosum subsp. pretiosum]